MDLAPCLGHTVAKNSEANHPFVNGDFGKWAYRFTGCCGYSASATGLSFEETMPRMRRAIEELEQDNPGSLFKYGSAYNHQLDSRTQSTRSHSPEFFCSGSCEERFCLVKDFMNGQGDLHQSRVELCALETGAMPQPQVSTRI